MIYILAQPQKEILKEAYSGKFKQPCISYLFDNTEMPDLKESGPILLSDKNVEEQTFKQLLQQHAGLLIRSDYSEQDILAQLRHNLFVYFKPDQIGIFRYYDPYIASYFFPHLNQQETFNWLGPINTIEWFNTDWRNKVNLPDQWQRCDNSLANNWHKDKNHLQNKHILTKAQMLALQEMQEEKFAYYWQQDITKNPTQIDIDKTIYWVKQGISTDFTSEDTLNQYLTLRAMYPNATPPDTWPSELAQEKIQYLQDYLQTAKS